MKEVDIQKFVGGLVFIIVLVKVLKKLIRAPRPYMGKDSTFGMPSTRAASLFYIVTFLILVNNISQKTIIFLVAAAVLCCVIKYVMQEHSLRQLIAGAIMGVAIAYLINSVKYKMIE